MYCWNWGGNWGGMWNGMWGHPFYGGSLIGLAFQAVTLGVIVWGVVTVVKSLTAHKNTDNTKR